MIKNLPANAGDPGNVGSIPRLGRFPGVGSRTHCSLAWKISWTEEPGALHGVAKSQT